MLLDILEGPWSYSASVHGTSYAEGRDRLGAALLHALVGDKGVAQSANM